MIVTTIPAPSPEERHGIESLPVSENVSRRSLALALGDDPALHADAIARVAIGSAGDITASNISEALVSRYSLTAMPRSIADSIRSSSGSIARGKAFEPDTPPYNTA